MPVTVPITEASVALVHDWLNQMGGAEYVLAVLHDMLPQAPVFTSLYHKERMPTEMKQWDIRTSLLNYVPLLRKRSRLLLPFYPHAFARMDLSERDLVISIKSAFSLGVTTKRSEYQAHHICYCLTPTRFLWNFDAYMHREQVSGLARNFSRLFIHHLRNWEVEAAQQVDQFIAISRTVQERIRTCYGRESTIIHPPVNTQEFQVANDLQPTQDHYLIVSRLIPYKRIDLAVEAFNRMPDRKLVIVGEGRDEAALRAAAQGNIVFAGYLDRPQVVELMTTCRAFIFPGEEDFGITPVEALSAGKPVIAYEAGGALDYVKNDTTGIFFQTQEPEALAQAVEDYERRSWDPAICRQQAQQFSVEAFRQKMGDFLGQALRHRDTSD